MKVTIEYCMQWNYEPRAFRLREEVSHKYPEQIEDFNMIQSGGGVFEVSVNDSLIFSKKSLNRFPEDGEIIELVKRFGLI